MLAVQAFRESGGRLKVWGKAPRKIEARYETGDGKTKTSLLLASGEPHAAPLACPPLLWLCAGVLRQVLY